MLLQDQNSQQAPPTQSQNAGVASGLGNGVGSHAHHYTQIIGGLERRLGQLRNHHAETERTYMTTYNTQNEKQRRDTLQLQQQYLNNTNSAGGTKSKNQKNASGGSGNAKGNKRSNSVSSNNNTTPDAPDVKSNKSAKMSASTTKCTPSISASHTSEFASGVEKGPPAVLDSSLLTTSSSMNPQGQYLGLVEVKKEFVNSPLFDLKPDDLVDLRDPSKDFAFEDYDKLMGDSTDEFSDPYYTEKFINNLLLEPSYNLNVSNLISNNMKLEQTNTPITMSNAMNVPRMMMNGVDITQRDQSVQLQPHIPTSAAKRCSMSSNMPGIPSRSSYNHQNGSRINISQNSRNFLQNVSSQQQFAPNIRVSCPVRQRPSISSQHKLHQIAETNTVQTRTVYSSGSQGTLLSNNYTLPLSVQVPQSNQVSQQPQAATIVLKQIAEQAQQKTHTSWIQASSSNTVPSTSSDFHLISQAGPHLPHNQERLHQIRPNNYYDAQQSQQHQHNVSSQGGMYWHGRDGQKKQSAGITMHQQQNSQCITQHPQQQTSQQMLQQPQLQYNNSPYY